MPKISIVLPVYNGEAYLFESIESVLGQTFKDFELIIVDDCSTDKTSSIAQECAEKDTRIVYVRNKKNLKLPAALNKGFSLASGEYWTWTSCDNAYFPNALDEMAQVLANGSEVALTYASMDLIDANGQKVGEVLAGPPEDLIIRNVVGACFLYRSSLAQKVGSYSEDAFLCEDYEYWLRIATLNSIQPLEKVLYRYRLHSKSLSRNHEEEIIAKGIGIQKKYYPYFVKTRKKSAQFYAYLRARDIYNPLRYFYFFYVIYYSPFFFVKEIYRLIERRLREKNTNRRKIC